MIKFNKKGFTLIELLVVIAIIGILASIIMMQVLGMQAKARDGKRLADLKELANSIQLYYTQQGDFPKTGFCNWNRNDTGNGLPEGDENRRNSSYDPACLGGGTSSADNTFYNGLVTKGYMAQLPNDPLNKWKDNRSDPTGRADGKVNNMYYYYDFYNRDSYYSQRGQAAYNLFKNYYANSVMVIAGLETYEGFGMEGSFRVDAPIDMDNPIGCHNWLDVNGQYTRPTNQYCLKILTP